jgi:hypothetical protein
VKTVINLDAKPPLRIWLDTGTHEPGWERARTLRDALVEREWKLYDDLQYSEIEGADHSEGAWAARVDPMLRYLFPPTPKRPEATRSRQSSTSKSRPPILDRAQSLVSAFRRMAETFLAKESGVRRGGRPTIAELSDSLGQE